MTATVWARAAGRRAVGAGLLSALGAGAAAAQGLTDQQRREVLDVVREALRTDPSLLREALAGLQAAEDAELARRRAEAIANNAAALFRDPADPVRGNPRGDVTLVEFFDARCGYCRTFHSTMQALLQRDRNVRVVLKDLPILGPSSVLASRALLAAQRQGKYEALFDALLRLRTDTPETVIQAEAQRAGLDWTRLRRDMEDPAITRRIEANTALAQRLGIEGTPALVVGNTLVSGAVDLNELERLVREARARR